MGVPGLFPWIKKHFGDAVREKTTKHNIKFAENTCDNLYVDVNHILHACAHGLGLPKIKGEPHNGVFVHIESYLDWLLRVAQPQKLCFLAVDGVAPKAKLNQQRTRRFLAAHRKKLQEEFGQKVRRDMEEKSGREISQSERFDPNLISPGTPFMNMLCEFLRELVDKKVAEDDKWKKLKVILSSAKEPGEGEHKIISFIKDQRQREGYNPHTKHVVFGQDADLILLTLLTHEPDFRLLREQKMDAPGNLPDFVQVDMGMIRRYLKFGLNPFISPKEKGEASQPDPNLDPDFNAKNLVAPEMEKAAESKTEKHPEFGFEQTLEDFVCLSFMLGNDFVPAIPSVDIYDRYGGMDRLVHCYKLVRKRRMGFLTQSGKIQTSFFKEVLSLISTDEIDAYRRIKNRVRRDREKMQHDDEQVDKPNEHNFKESSFERDGFISVGALPKNVSVDEALRGKFSSLEMEEEKLNADLESMDLEQLEDTFLKRVENRITLELLKDMDSNPTRFGEHGYHDRYYMNIGAAKSRLDCTLVGLQMGKAYFEAMCWSLAYYVVGVSPVATTEGSLLVWDDVGNDSKSTRGFASWDWCYQYDYAPLIGDLLRGCQESPSKRIFGPNAIMEPATGLSTNKGPVPPLLQLLAIQPAENAYEYLPRPLAKLLKATLKDPKDRDLRKAAEMIRYMYPSDLGDRIDSRGKRWAHSVVVRLPEVDYRLISEAAEMVIADDKLSEEDQENNSFDCGELYLSKEVEAKLREAAEAAVLESGRKFEWGDEDGEARLRDPILDLVPGYDSIEDEDGDEATICFPLDIAGIHSGGTPCEVLPGVLEEYQLEGTQFYIKPLPTDGIGLSARLYSSNYGFMDNRQEIGHHKKKEPGKR